MKEESREKKSFFSENFDSREENLFAKSHSIEKRNFLQNLEFREENKNFVFKILTIEIISRNEHSILQLEIEKNGPFPLEIFSRSRISSMPDTDIHAKHLNNCLECIVIPHLDHMNKILLAEGQLHQDF